jgi:hypothetical protein
MIFKISRSGVGYLSETWVHPVAPNSCPTPTTPLCQHGFQPSLTY